MISKCVCKSGKPDLQTGSTVAGPNRTTLTKLLLGGSPCTHWSIAQSRHRETRPEGQGGERFRNYLIAKVRYQPDYFLYENNKSMAPAIREQITAELGVEPIFINSALMSAQSRQRLYWTNIPGVEQPEDRGLVLRDILESGLPLREKGYTLKANCANANAANARGNGNGHCYGMTKAIPSGGLEPAAPARNTS